MEVSKSTTMVVSDAIATKDAGIIAVELEFTNVAIHESAEYLEQDSMIVRLSSEVEIKDPHLMEYSAKGHDAAISAFASAIFLNPPQVLLHIRYLNPVLIFSFLELIDLMN